MSEATDVLQAIDQLRRDLSGYHGQLKAHNDLQVHCDHQRERIVQLEGLYAKAEAENAKLRKLCADMHVTLDGMNEQSFSVSGYVFCADVCPHWMGECSMLHPDECWYEQALRELGIEVDE